MFSIKNRHTEMEQLIAAERPRLLQYACYRLGSLADAEHTIMLDNLPAYTVKNILIYDKWGEQSEFLGQHVMGDNRYVMDVKLKKEYSIGTLGLQQTTEEEIKTRSSTNEAASRLPVLAVFSKCICCVLRMYTKSIHAEYTLYS